uniref:Uncharacterized protein n=1 Tax=Ciona savignyi TaxID=51511 RepID=H2YVV4_CIOSA
MIYPLNQLITIPTTNIYGYGDTTL